MFILWINIHCTKQNTNKSKLNLLIASTYKIFMNGSSRTLLEFNGISPLKYSTMNTNFSCLVQNFLKDC